MKKTVCATLFFFSISIVTATSAFPKNSCGNLLKRFASDVLKIADLYETIPLRTKNNLSVSVEAASEPDIDNVVQFYEKYFRYAAAAPFLATIGYVAAHISGVPFIADHYSSFILMPAIMNLAYTTAAENYPIERKRLLVDIILLSVAVHSFWEIGPLKTGLERIVPQSPRQGTDWGDLIAGISSSALFFPFIQAMESIHRKLIPRASKSDATRQ